MAEEPASATQPPETVAAAVSPRTVDAGRGVGWWSEGWRLFTPAVGPWILIVVIGFVLNLILAFIPVLGSIAGHLLFPIFAGGLMLGCRAIDRGEPLTIGHLFAGFGPKAGSLLIVALIYLVAAIAITIFVAALLFVFFGAALLSQLWSTQDPLSTAEAMGGLTLIILVGLLLFLLLYLPLVMAVWFAPALVVLQGAEPWAAMKLSFIGSVKNILPFLIYSLVGIALAIVATIPLLLGWLVLGPVTVASVYASYCDIFEQPGAVSAASV
ncbi:MAG TPA: BPSS1780 family membrane protein [Casimicrobiaceae bacterium]|jgi:uncharacterized membrane protein|nr:BPSS1780 family membrane protein [Casimicrobiaceae bacterium]